MEWEQSGEEEWLPEDLEAAYLRALEANDAVEHEFAAADTSTANSDSEAENSNEDDAGVEESLEAAFTQPPEANEDSDQSESDDDSATTNEADSGEDEQPDTTIDEQTEKVADADQSSAENADGDVDVESNAGDDEEEGDPEILATIEPKSAPRVTPHQVVEAALFVGGVSLTVKKLASLLGADANNEKIEGILDELNSQYLTENRPYEVKLVEGGYRLELRSEYDRVRNRVYGLGPKEVKLSQDAVEVLALVAYRQPITQSGIEKLGKGTPGGALRQLLRRELIYIERGRSRKEDVKYHTTPRFLSLFGLGDLEELPQADELNLK